MVEETLSDEERLIVRDALVRLVPSEAPPSQEVLRLIALFSGSDTTVLCRRGYAAPAFEWRMPPEVVAAAVAPPAPLPVYEVDVRMTLDRTMRIRAPDGVTAQQLALGWYHMARQGTGELSSILKWSDGREAYRPMPVETIVSEPGSAAIGEARKVSE